MKFVRQLLSRLARAGVREWVVATGARNLDLVRELIMARDACVWHGFEERSCGFFALGRIQGGAGPVAVVTTSGTAVAELLPAVIEAHYQGLPLVVVSADRPPHFRGSGAPQAIEQAGIMQPYCGWTADLSTSNPDGGGLSSMPQRLPWNRPAHINVCLDEPQPPSGAETVWSLCGEESRPEEWTDESGVGAVAEQVAEFLQRDRPTVALVAGLNDPNERRSVANWLKRAGLPALWECTAGWGDSVLEHGLGNPVIEVPPGAAAHEGLLQQLEVGQVLRVGSVPSWRWWRDLEQRTEVEVLSLSRSGHRGLGRSTACKGLAVDLTGLGGWETSPAVCPAELPNDVAATLLHEACSRFPASEPALLAALNGALDSNASVFIGNSLPIREWNLISPGMPARRCHAARGANGIDGQISHGLGLGSHSRELWVVVGDLTALYDLSAPSWVGQMAKRQPGLRVRLVVVNNGGGRIFARLPAFSGLDEDQRKVTENRHNLGFEGWASLWGSEHRVVCNTGEVGREMVSSLPDIVILEFRPDEGQTSGFWQWWEREARVNPQPDGG